MSWLVARVVGAVAAGVVALFVPWAAYHYWQKTRSQGAQARVERSQAQAASNSAADAVGTVAASGEASAASEQLTRENEQQIRAAPGANVPVSSEVDAAGRAALCRRDAYRGDPRCKH